jgi:hypothetical protein
MKDLMPDKDEDITKLTKEQASEVIETRAPTGLFYTNDNGLFIGIDNSSGDAWTEEFKTKESCFKWLRGGRARDAHGQWLGKERRKQMANRTDLTRDIGEGAAVLRATRARRNKHKHVQRQIDRLRGTGRVRYQHSRNGRLRPDQ